MTPTNDHHERRETVTVTVSPDVPTELLKRYGSAESAVQAAVELYQVMDNPDEMLLEAARGESDG